MKQHDPKNQSRDSRVYGGSLEKQIPHPSGIHQNLPPSGALFLKFVMCSEATPCPVTTAKPVSSKDSDSLAVVKPTPPQHLFYREGVYASHEGTTMIEHLKKVAWNKNGALNRWLFHWPSGDDSLLVLCAVVQGGDVQNGDRLRQSLRGWIETIHT